MTKGIFDGLKYLEFGSGAAGPVAARYFAEQGARVIRVESALRPDFLRLLALTPDRSHGLDDAPMFVLLNANKESIAIDMTKPEGIELVKKLVAWADVVCENFSPGVMQKLGLDYESLAKIRPGLVMVSASLYGQTGPEKSYPGFGGQSSAIAGFNHLTGWPDREAIGPFGTIVDSLAPRYVAILIAAALIEQRRTGRGTFVDFSQIEAAVYTLSEMTVRFSANSEIVGRRGNRDEVAVPSGIYPCRPDGSFERFIAISVASDEAWNALARVMKASDWATKLATAAQRRAREDEIDERIARFTRERDAFDVAKSLDSAGVESAVVENEDDLLRDPQLAHRGHFTELRHRHLGPLQFESSAIRFSDFPPRIDRPAPDLGEHTTQILETVLGLSPDAIRALRERGILT